MVFVLSFGRCRNAARKPHGRALARTLGLTGAAAWFCGAMCVAAVGHAEEQAVLQPLDTFLRAARAQGDTNRQARAQAVSDAEQLKVATGRLLPSFAAQGSYTRNQYHADFVFPAPTGSSAPPTRLTIMPSDQLDGSLTLTIPIINLEHFARRTVAKETARATQARSVATEQGTDKQVAQAYYALIGQQRVRQASLKSMAVAERAEAITRARLEAGSASPLELERAVADTAQAKQSVAEAALQVALAERALETMSRVSPAGEAALAVDDLHAEAPLSEWLGEGVAALPAVVAAEAQAAASLAGLRAANFGYVPTVAAKAQERFTNLTGLNGGHAMLYVLSATLSWNLDFTLTPLKRSVAAQAEASLATQHQTTRQAQDYLFEDWHRVRADIDKCRAARQESRAASLAATISLDQYEVGAATQLDVLQATKDAFNADIKRIQADSDLLFQRVLLRLDAGLPPVLEEKS